MARFGPVQSTNCNLALASGKSQPFSFCAPIAGTPITLYWSVLSTGRRRLFQATSPVMIGFR